MNIVCAALILQVKMGYIIEYVEWADSFGVESGWQNPVGRKPNIVVTKSIGWVVFEDKNVLSISGNYAKECDETIEQVNGIMNIPKKCILKRKRIKFAL